MKVNSTIIMGKLHTPHKVLNAEMLQTFGYHEITRLQDDQSVTHYFRLIK